MTFVDNAKVTLGTGGDADLYYDGSDTILLTSVAGTGGLGIGTAPDLMIQDGVHIKTGDSGAAANANGDELIIEGSANSGISILSGASNVGRITFNSSDTSSEGAIAYVHGTTDTLVFNSGDPTAESMRMGGTSIWMSDTSNANMTGGLTINQLTADNEIFAVKSSDVAHGRTSITETDTYCFMKKLNGDYGGLNFGVMADDIALATVARFDVVGGQASTGKSTTDFGMWDFRAQEHDGSNNPANVTANGNVFTVSCRRDSGGSPAFLNCMLVDEDGDLYSVTSAQTFDVHDDIALVDSYDGIRSDMSDFNKEHEAELIRLGVLGAPIAEGGMTNVTQLQRLHNGAIRQLHQQVETVKEFYEDKIAALESRLMRLEN